MRFALPLNDKVKAAILSLSPTAFPNGAADIFIRDSVLIAAPARVPVLVHLLRKQIVDNHLLKLTVDRRAEKSERLYAMITSERATDLWEQHGRATHALMEIERSDAKWQERVRGRRLAAIQSVSGVRDKMLSAVHEILVTPP